MNIGIVGLGHSFEKQLLALNNISEFNLCALCDIEATKLKNYSVPCYLDYKDLLGNCDCVLIASPPNSHFEISKFFIQNNIGIIMEKPLVVSKNELSELQKYIRKYNSTFYNSLHFAYGLEIDWFIKNISCYEIPKKIYVYISDRYVENGKIKKQAHSLNGAYLDETINPLSAICRIYENNLKFLENNKKYFEDDLFDYYSLSKFELTLNHKKIQIEIKVEWNSNKDDKYIDLNFEDRIIRLDSMNQQVILLNNAKTLFKANGDRMTNHYLGVFNNFLTTFDNKDFSLKIHEVLLEGV